MQIKIINVVTHLFLEKCLQYHGHKGDIKATCGTCNAIDKKTQVILM